MAENEHDRCCMDCTYLMENDLYCTLKKVIVDYPFTSLCVWYLRRRVGNE